MRANQSTGIKLFVLFLAISFGHATLLCEQLENVTGCNCTQTSYESELYCLADPDVVLRLDDETLQITCKVPKQLTLATFPRTSDIDAESFQVVNCSIPSSTTFKQILQHFGVKNTNSFSYEGGNMGRSSTRARLSGFSHLESVSIIDSNITELHENTFDDITNMTKLDLSSNALKQLPVNVFRNLQNLEILILTENKLESLTVGLFSHLEKLESLWLDKNRLRSLAKGTFEGLGGSLRQLDITQNKLRELENGVFDDISGLTHLDLSENRLTTISEKIFRRLVNLEELKIDDNHLATIHTNAFANTVKLQDLYLSKNELSFDGVGVRNSPFRNLNNLWSLNLNSNKITAISSGWRKLKELSILSLKFNRIETLNYDDLNFKAKEVYVNLEDNNIKNLLVPSNASYRNSIDVYITKIDCCRSDLSRLSSIFSIEDLQCTSPKSMVNRNIAQIKPMSSVCDLDECASKCTCSNRLIDNTLMLNCSTANLQLLPRFSINANYSHVELHIGRDQSAELPQWLTDLNVKIIRRSPVIVEYNSDE